MSVMLKHLADINPDTPGFATDDEVTFLPLEAVWPGRTDYSATRPANTPGYSRFRRGDVVMPKITPTFEAGRVICTDDAPTHLGLATTEVHVVRPHAPEAAGYFSYLLRSQPFLQEGGTTLEGVGNLRRVPSSWLEKVPVPVTDLGRQTAIASFLDRETAKIDSLARKQEELVERLGERLRAATERILEPLWTAEPLAPIAQFAGHGGAFFDGDWVESQDQDPEGEYRLLQLADVGVNEFRDRSDRRVAGEAFTRLRCSPVFENDILIARMPDPIGRACLVPSELGRTITVVDVAVLRLSEDDPAFVSRVINSGPVQSLIEVAQDGATRQRIPRSKLGKILIPRPVPDRQRDIAAELQAIERSHLDLSRAARRQLALLGERRSALITAAVTGQLGIPEEAA